MTSLGPFTVWNSWTLPSGFTWRGYAKRAAPEFMTKPAHPDRVTVYWGKLRAMRVLEFHSWDTEEPGVTWQMLASRAGWWTWAKPHKYRQAEAFYRPHVPDAIRVLHAIGRRLGMCA